MEAFHLSLALAPLALYLLGLGVINLARRPLLTTGARDIAALGIAISGFVIVGPMQLFLPESAAVRFGPYVWLLLLSFYGLSVTLWILISRPRLIIYNVTADQLRPILSDVVGRLDHESRWAGDSLVLPQLGIQLHLDQYRPMRNVSLVAAGNQQSFAGWRRLEETLRPAIRESEVVPNPRGFTLLALGLVMIGYPLCQLMIERDSVAQQIFEMLRL